MNSLCNNNTISLLLYIDKKKHLSANTSSLKNVVKHTAVNHADDIRPYKNSFTESKNKVGSNADHNFRSFYHMW